MKRIGKKGFTLIELLAVIVVLSIILVITVPTILNSISTVRQDALQASADAAAKYYSDQLGMVFIGVKQEGFVVDAKLKSDTGKLASQAARCITKEEAHILGLNTKDYSINVSCTGNNILTDTCYNNTLNHSTVKWDEDGNATVRLFGKEGGKFVNDSNPLVVISSSLKDNFKYFNQEEDIVLTDTVAGKSIKDLKIYGNSIQNGTPTPDAPVEIQSVGERTVNLFDIESYGTLKDSNSQPYVLDISQYKVGTKITMTTKDVYYYKISETAGGAGTYQYKTNNHTFTLTEGMINLGHLYIISPSTFGVETQENLRNQNVQIELGSTTTEYEPYGYKIPVTVSNGSTTNTTNIYLDEPLRAIGEYRDYIDFESGKIVRKISNKNITASSVTAKSDSSIDTHSYYFMTFSDAKTGTRVPILSNIGGYKLSDLSLRNKEGIFTNSNTIFFIAFFDIKTLADAKQFVTDNNVYANYILKNPTEESIELPTITTLDGTTALSVNTLVKPLIEGSY